MPYDIYPSVDENYLFPPEVRKNLVDARGRIPDGTNIDNLRSPGIYAIAGSGHSVTLTNLPPGVGTGSIHVFDSGQGSGKMQSQIVYGNARSGTWFREAMDTSGSWSAWVPLGWDRGDIRSYADLDTYTVSGKYGTSGARVDTLVNAPPLDGAASFEVFSSKSTDGVTHITQVAYVAGPSGSIFVRNTIDDNKTFGPWVDIIGGGNNFWAQHSLRVSEFTRRRGGVLGTYGYGAVAFRFDHNWDDFIKPGGIAELMEKYNMVGSMAVPAQEFDPEYHNYSTSGSFSTMQKWALDHGMEIMSHSYTHGDAQSTGDLVREIQDSRKELEAKMPNIKVDLWAQPGTVPPTGKETYGGMGPIQTIEQMANYRAGQLLLGNYAVVGGHMDGYYRELNGIVDQGLVHVTIEKDLTSENAISILNQASRTGTGVVMMMHPNVIGTADRMSMEVLEQVFKHVANLRAQGKIQNITVGGMALADSSSDRRRDICYNGSFLEGGDGWSYDSTWSFTNNSAVTSGTSAISQGESMSRRAGLAGSFHELVADASVSSSTVVELRVWDERDPTVLDFKKEFTMDPGGNRVIRIPFGIPYANNAGVPTIQPKWSIRKVSGGTLTVSSIRVQSI